MWEGKRNISGFCFMFPLFQTEQCSINKSSCCRLFKQYLLLLLINQTASALFRFIAAAGRNMIVANTFGSFSLLMLFALGGFVLSRGTSWRDYFKKLAPSCSQVLIMNLVIAAENVKKWWIWGYWSSPLMYAQNAIVVNEFLGNSWNKVVST